MSYSLLYWTEKDFSEASELWADLLLRSNANPLFMSWAWQYSWWCTWSQQQKLTLNLMVVYRNSNLVALVPLFKVQAPVHGLFSVSRLQFIGNLWDQCPTVRSEYISPIIDSNFKAEVLSLISSELFDRSDWQDFIFTDITVDSDGWALYQNLADLGGAGFLKQSEIGYAIKAQGQDFHQYVKSLGKNTRLKLYNRRRYLRDHYGALDNNEETDKAKFFIELNNFHKKRWGKSCFDAYALKFHNDFILRSKKSSIVPLMHRVKLNDKYLSTCYDVSVAGKSYNLQLGFVERFDKKVSLGTLHLGFSIERSFLRSDISYDFLAGEGKNSDYKRLLGGVATKFYVCQISRNKPINIINRVKNYIPSILVRFVRRLVGSSRLFRFR